MEFVRPRALFASRSEKVWLILFFFCVYIAFCWTLYTIAVEPLYGQPKAPTIEADSATYFEAAASIGSGRGPLQIADLVGFGGSSLGPALIAITFRTRFGVACFNCLLFLAAVWCAGFVPGVRRSYFLALMAIEPQMIPTLMTLNKEIMAIAGLVSFSAYIFPREARGRRRGSKWFLAAAFILSAGARWEQGLILLWYLAIDSRLSPLRGHPRKAIVALLLFASAGWAGAVHVLHLNLGGFIAAVQGAGTVARLYAIQEKGGYFLIAFPKIIMLVSGRWITPAYFLYDYWQAEPDLSWQNQYIGILSSLCMLCMLGTVIWRGRFRLDRRLIHLTLIYAICTAINPVIQPRYIFPAYVLLALEMSRRVQTLEPVKPLRRLLPSLPPSYRLLQAGGMARFK